MIGGHDPGLELSSVYDLSMGIPTSELVYI
jgi:hypothetical protein